MVENKGNELILFAHRKIFIRKFSLAKCLFTAYVRLISSDTLQFAIGSQYNLLAWSTLCLYHMTKTINDGARIIHELVSIGESS